MTARLRAAAPLVALALLLAGMQGTAMPVRGQSPAVPAAPTVLAVGGTPAAAGAAAGSQSSGNPRPVTQIIVKYRSSQLANRAEAALPERLAALSSAAGVTLQYRRPMSGGAHVLSLPGPLPDNEAWAIAARLGALPDVEFAEPDEIRQPLLGPNDPNYAQQWDLFDAQGGIDLPGAWDLTTGSSNVVIAVLDTGIITHADLAGRILPGYNFITSPFMAGNNFGRGPDASDLGDYVTAADPNNNVCPGQGTSKSSWHGSHVAGTIAASSNNNLGVTGINWVSQILPVRVLGKCGGMDSDILDAMHWAAGMAVPGVPSNLHPAQILNMSLGGPVTPGTTGCPAAWQAAVNDLVGAGKLIVVAAGNSNTDVSNFVPANCTGVMAVAATTKSGARATYSNYGPGLAISAPGGDSSWPMPSWQILSTANSRVQGPDASPKGDTYALKMGTSMAAPHVAGVASLVLSINPGLSLAQLRQILQSTARAFPAGSNCTTASCGAGIVDAYAALKSIAMPAITSLSPPFVEAGGPAFSLTVDGSNFLANAVVYWNGSPRPTTVVNSGRLSASISAADIAQVGIATITVANAAPGLTSGPAVFAIAGPLSLRSYLPLLRR